MRGAAPPAGTIGAAGGGGGWYAPPTPGPLNRNTVAFTLGSEMKQGVHALTVIVCLKVVVQATPIIKREGALRFVPYVHALVFFLYLVTSSRIFV